MSCERDRPLGKVTVATRSSGQLRTYLRFGHMRARKQPPIWWRTDFLAKVVLVLIAALVAATIARAGTWSLPTSLF